MTTTSPFRRLWARLWLRHSQFTGSYGKLKALYTINDPWNLSSNREQQRYRRMNQLVSEFAPGCQQLLELGAGEGLQTCSLLEVSEHVTGIEVSAQAVERAALRCPQAEFLVGRAEDLPTLLPGRRFDIATAFEVLYYAQEPAGILAELQSVAGTILVTNYMTLAVKMGSLFDGPGWRRLDDLVVEDVSWRVDVWQAQAAGDI
jgi:trans-aconitate methyltransferase